MARIQAELAAERAAAPSRLPIAVLGINQIGSQGGLVGFPASDSIPWVQDTPADSVWIKWRVSEERGITYRDVVVLDRENRVITAYNVTDHSLGAPANYEALKTILRDAATP